MVYEQKERRERVLETIIDSFIKQGEEVSSAFVSRECGLGLSSASIRSIMKELEEDGYLTQPHTSAGRVPTVKGYRYYVRNLMSDVCLDDTELEPVRKVIEEGMREYDADLFMSHMSSVLSEVTDLIGVAMVPSFERGIFDRIEIANLGGSSFLLILSLKSGFVNTIRITLDHVIPRWKIEETARLLSERLHGLTVHEIKAYIGHCLRDTTCGDRTLVEVILKKSDRIFDFSGEKNIYVAGLAKVLAHPEFTPVDHSLKLVDMVEHKNEIIDALMLSIPESNEVSIHIGGSGSWGSSPPLSLISAAYHSGPVDGAIGIIGPTRVHYPRVSALVRYAAAFTSHFFASC